MRSSARTAAVIVFVFATACFAGLPSVFSGATRLSPEPSPTSMDPAAGKIGVIPGNSYELKQLAPGVYAAVRHVEAGTLDGNTMFIINDADVVVVDAGVYPTSARQMIAEIRKLTSKPVRYVINTHWHGDHVMGNQAYREAFPGVEIVSHPATRGQFILNLPLEKLVPAYRAEIANIQKKLDSGKDSDGKPLTAARRKHIELAKSDFEFWIKDANAIPLPTMTLADSLVLHRGDRTIEVKCLGKGHTDGDLVVYLPKERIVATGDLVVHPIPFGGSQYLREWPATLRALKRLNAATIVPGHGEIQSGWTYVDRQIALFESTWEQVKKAVDAGADLEATRKAVNGDALSKAFGATSPEARDEFDYTYLDSAIESAFKALRPDSATNQ